VGTPLSDADCDRLAGGWLSYQAGHKEDRAAWDALAILTADDPESACKVTLRLLERATHADLIGTIGAGPWRKSSPSTRPTLLIGPRRRPGLIPDFDRLRLSG